jgi:hypothetical protein
MGIFFIGYLLALYIQKYGKKFENYECLTLLLFLRVSEVEFFALFIGTCLQIQNLEFSNNFNILNSVLCLLFMPIFVAVYVMIYF